MVKKKELTAEERWEQGIPHDPRSEDIARGLDKIDIESGMFFDWKFGGDGDNGEELMYHLDIYFERLDKANGKNAK